jgi:uncharacterized protein
MKLILDTNILISSFVFDNIIEKLFVWVLESDDIEIYSCNVIWSEIEIKFLGARVQKIAQKSKREIDQSHIETFLKLLKPELVFVEPTLAVNICRDPKDNIFLELAREVDADYIITGDQDLLELETFENCRILKPSQFISQFQL